MANFIAIADGNLTAAGTWATTSAAANANLVSTNTGATALDTTNRDSATFVPAASAIQYIAIRLSARAAGSPTNKLTVILRNSSTGTDILTWVINVSDLPVCDNTADQGGWIILRASASHTPGGVNSYLIRCKLDSTSTAVSLSTNGTANNWQRLIGLTTTGAPGVGDDMFIGGWFDNTNNPATFTNRTVTQDQTAATDYGSNSTNARQPALLICKGGTLTWPTTANSLLQLSGHLIVYSGGTFNMGTVASPIDASHTATLQFDTAANDGFGALARDGSTFNAVWVGYTRSWTLLDANAAIGATTLTVAHATGWKNGDNVIIATTTTTNSQSESRTLNADAGATSLSISVGLTNAHTGDSSLKNQAEIINMTRNLIIKAVGANSTFVQYFGTATGTIKWARLESMGGANIGLKIQGTGTINVSYCSFINQVANVYPINLITADNFTLDNNVSYYTFSGINYLAAMVGTNYTISNNVFISTNSGTNGITFNGTGGTPYLGTISANRFIGMSVALNVGTIQGGTISDCVGHCLNYGYYNPSVAYNITLERFTAWSLAQFAISFATRNYNCKVIDCWVNGGGILFNDDCFNIIISGLIQSAGSYGVRVLGVNIANILFENCDFGVTADTITADFALTIPNNYINYIDVRLRNVIMHSAVKLIGYANMHPDSRIMNSDAGGFTTYKATGLIAPETGAIGGVTHSIKLTPALTTNKLEIGANVYNREILIPVDSGDAPTVSIDVYKDGSYNGNQPRLILKRDSSMGVLSDSVLDTMSGGATAWESLTGTLPAAPNDGVYSLVVDCDGTAGNAYVANVLVNGVAYSTSYWLDGVPCVPIAGGAPPPVTPPEYSHTFFGVV